MDSRLFLDIGIILLTFSLILFVALWTAQLFNNTPLGVVVGTGLFTALYLGAVVLPLDLLVISPIAIGLSAIAIAIASITANIEVSRAEI